MSTHNDGESSFFPGDTFLIFTSMESLAIATTLRPVGSLLLLYFFNDNRGEIGEIEERRLQLAIQVFKILSYEKTSHMPTLMDSLRKEQYKLDAKILFLLIYDSLSFCCFKDEVSNFSWM